MRNFFDVIVGILIIIIIFIHFLQPMPWLGDEARPWLGDEALGDEARPWLEDGARPWLGDEALAGGRGQALAGGWG